MITLQTSSVTFGATFPRGEGEYGGEDPLRHRAQRDATSPRVGGLTESLRLKRTEVSGRLRKELPSGRHLWRTVRERSRKKPPTLGFV